MFQYFLSAFSQTARCVLAVLWSGLAFQYLLFHSTHADDVKQTTLRVNLPESVISLDPQNTTMVAQAQILQGLCEGLVIWGRDQKPIPAVATHWAHEKNMVWTFHLRKDACWSDGRPLTAQDFVRSWKRLCAPGNLFTHAYVFAEKFPIKNATAIFNGQVPESELGLEAVDEHTLRITLSAPMAEENLLQTLCSEIWAPTHPEYLEAVLAQSPEAERRYISNGAFTIQQWRRGTQLEVVKNPYYRDADKVEIEKMVYSFVDDLTLSEVGFQNGQWDICQIKSVEASVSRRLKNNFAQAFCQFPTACLCYGSYNLDSPVCSDLRVRQALNLLFDKELLIQEACTIGTVEAFGLVPPILQDHVSYQPYFKGWNRQKRQAQATRLLKAAGYSLRKPLKLKVIHCLGEKFSETLRQRAWVHPWLELTVTTVDLPTRGMLIAQKKYEFAVLGEAFEEFTPSYILELFTQSSGRNAPGYRNPRYDTLVNQAVSLDASSEQKQASCQAAEKMLLDEVAVMPILFRPTCLLISTKLQPLVLVGPGSIVDYKHIRFR